MCVCVCVYIRVMCMYLRSLVARMRECMFISTWILMVTFNRVCACVHAWTEASNRLPQILGGRQTPKHCVHSEESVTQTLVGAFSSPGLLRYRTVRDSVDALVVSCRAAVSVRSCRMCAPVATIVPKMYFTFTLQILGSECRARNGR